MNRKDFILRATALGTALAFSPDLLANDKTSSLIKSLVKGNDEHVADLLKRGDGANRHGGRSLGYNFAKFAASYCNPQSLFYQKEELVSKLKETIAGLNAILSADGTINAGNLESPPDTAFIMEPLCSGVYILMQSEQKSLDPIKKSIKEVVLKVGEALTTGGVHTPNHRWEICAALAWVNKLYPNKKYVARIDEWLSEGVYMDEDGHYPERSMNYSDVENRAFITMGHLLKRPELYKPAIKSLEMTWYYMDPNGDLITFDSRRQDQYSSRKIIVQYLHYRFLAIELQNPNFSAIASLIEKQAEFRDTVLNEALYCFMADEVLMRELPKAEMPSVNFEKLFKTSSLLRIRRKNTAMTLFGGNDWPLIIASGRSVSPNFFGYRKGQVALKYMRMSARFFSTGYFRSEGITQQDGKYILHRKIEAPYYQPLKSKDRRTDGDYALTPSTDDRFWSKMDFEKRPVSNVKTLDSKVTFYERDGEATLEFEVTGLEGVAVTIHLCFDEDGILSGVNDKQFLEKGNATFTNAQDTITFGPGVKKHDWIQGLEGEKYSVHFGSLQTSGQHVYLTGFTPFKHTLHFS